MNNILKITSPSSFEQEKKYLFEVIFSEFLGLEYELKFSEQTDYVLTFNGSKELAFSDSFFHNIKDEMTYLHKKNLPKDISFCSNEFLEEENIPILYGDNTLLVSKNSIHCGIDVFASVFFMLSRWEEYVVKDRDKHNRFSAHSSIAYKYNFLNRPIVNEYIEMLWNMMHHLDFKQNRKKRVFNWLLTHDVDYIKKWTLPHKLFRSVMGDLYKRKSISQAFRSIFSYVSSKLKFSKDPFDTFDFLMSISEENGLKSYFFFMSGGQSQYDNNYSIIDALPIITKIKQRGHQLGIHASYNAYNDPKLLSSEIKKMEMISNQKMTFGRGHFLRYDAPLTARIWDENKLSWDSTLCYADEPGFRCGVCYEFPVFDFIHSKMLSLKQKPLILMEATLLDYKKLSDSEIIDRFSYFKKKVEKYKGEFVVLWHNSSFSIGPYKNCKKIYKQILSNASK